MKLLAIGAAATAFAASAAELSEAEVDRLCPPRPETAAEFKAGTYPPAARPYREAALKAFAYMASLPAMRTLVETGEPEQTYQHNAYVSKTHAAHINLMLEWAKREPARRNEALRFAKASAEYLLTQLEPTDAPLAWWPPTYGRKPLRCDAAASGVVAEGQEHVTALKDGYAALEQYQDHAGINGRADEYSWSATIWYILTGTRPPNALQRKMQQLDPKVPHKVRGKIPESVRRALLKGMAIQQQDRYATMDKLIRKLDTGEEDSKSGWKIVLIFAAIALAILIFAVVGGLLPNLEG